VHNRRQRFDLASARAAAGEGRIAEWVGEFLASPGSDNATLAAGLAQRRHWWLGPLRLPIDHLTRLAGPELSVECPIDPAEWNDDVDLMTDELDEGWEPPPLLAQWSPEYGALLVQDGNHRLEALQREGASHAWVIAWFDDPNDLDRFLAKILATEDSR
jgi:hypothetical protein